MASVSRSESCSEKSTVLLSLVLEMFVGLVGKRVVFCSSGQVRTIPSGLVSLSVCLSTSGLSVCLPVVCVCLSVCLPVVCLSVYQWSVSVCLSVYQWSVCLSTSGLSVYQWSFCRSFLPAWLTLESQECLRRNREDMVTHNNML